MKYSTIEITGNVLISHHIKLDGDIHIAIGSGSIYPKYTGDYTVIPRVYVQTLDTNDKIMTDDVTVLEIPKGEVENIYHGVTVTIG